MFLKNIENQKYKEMFHLKQSLQEILISFPDKSIKKIRE